MKAFMNWSGGKDSSLALHYALREKIDVQKLLTNVNAVHDRISMHGVRRSLLEAQASALGIKLETIELAEQPSMTDYENVVSEKLSALKKEGLTHAIFGDIFLEDLKQYREQQLAKVGMQCIFPLWKIDTKELMKQFIDLGFKAIVVCINTNYLDKNFCGRLIDESFVNDLPLNVDVCGENGEYHSFVFDGPIFSKPVSFNKGEIVFKEYASPKNSNDCFTTPQASTGFYFCDLVPA